MNGITPPPSPPFLSTEECDLLKRTTLKQYPEDEQLTFIRICQRTHLDPFTKQIYATKRYQKVAQPDGSSKKVPTLVPVTGIMGLTAVADRTGNYEGCEISWCGPDGDWKTEWLSEEFPAAAKCIVFRKNRRPEVAIARWFSYVGQTYNSDTRKWETSDFWDKMPDYMLGKCAKAQALRGAFPDPLSNVYIKEELDSHLSDADTETLPEDEAKVAENQRREAELLKALVPGVRIVESHGPKPTPAEALEPAFPEDRVPEKPKTPPKKAQPPVAAAPQAPQSAATEPDDLDMTPPSAVSSQEPPSPPQPSPPAAAAEPVAQHPVEQQLASAQPWKEHVILGVSHVKFHKRKVGELNAAELGVIETQWLPAVREQWDDATDAQRADATAFEAAIAFNKMAKPW